MKPKTRGWSEAKRRAIGIRRTTGLGKAYLIKRKGFTNRLLLLKEGESRMIYYKLGRERRGKMINCTADYAEPNA
jgi:hypothetical protein